MEILQVGFFIYYLSFFHYQLHFPFVTLIVIVFHNTYRENNGRKVITTPESEEVIYYLDTLISLIVPKGRKEDIEAYAKEKGLSINGYIGELIREDMKLSDEAWKAAPAAPEAEG